jgi:hypothetical protein
VSIGKESRPEGIALAADDFADIAMMWSDVVLRHVVRRCCEGEKRPDVRAQCFARLKLTVSRNHRGHFALFYSKNESFHFPYPEPDKAF